MARNRIHRPMVAVTIMQTTWESNESAIKSIRMPVFVLEQNVPYQIDFDQNDAQAVHWVAFDQEHQPVGTARLLKDGHFGRMAVLKDFRHKGVGRLIMLAAIDYAKNLGMPTIYLNAQLPAEKFYESLEFERYGETFFEANIEHIGMCRDLDLI